MGRKVLLFVVAAVVLVLALGGAALAVVPGSPQDIYNDYAADGKLDGTYTDEQLQAYLDDALIDQYGDPEIVAELDAIVTRMLQDQQDEFPLTGGQLALMIFGAAGLAGIGLGLRRLARERA